MRVKMPANSPKDQTASIIDVLHKSFEGLFEITNEDSLVREKGLYGFLYARPSKRIRNILSLEREVLVLVSTFIDQQARTIRTARELIYTSKGRLEPSTFIIVHCDPRGNVKLKKWAREQSCVALPIYISGKTVPTQDEMLGLLAYELFSHDPFDVTGPVADDLNFYGRREEARELAKKLQTGQIRACFGIRKIGKTSIIHRIIREIHDNYSCSVIVVDCQRDAISALSAAKLINSMAEFLQTKTTTEEPQQLNPINADVELATASEKLLKVVLSSAKPIIVVFDEIDYITPGSPTAAHWRHDFNPFWRNVRAIYQQALLSKKICSIFISGVSSKWFSVESIDGVENAALSLVPEEYLGHLPRGAAAAMIRRLGKLAGLTFTDQVAETIAETCADMPFWIRKACSFIHSQLDILSRPTEPTLAFVKENLEKFAKADGTTMSFVALSHLFRVYPELKITVMQCAGLKEGEPQKFYLHVLDRYGIIKDDENPSISGLMLRNGIDLMNSSANDPFAAESAQEVTKEIGPGFHDWADEIAIISRRRNLLERKFRGVVANFIRFAALNDANRVSSKERALKGIPATRRKDLEPFDLDEIFSRLFWLELVALVKREWPLFEKIFGNQSMLDQHAQTINLRPDAHAKELDVIEVGMQRAALDWFEQRLNKV
jgi:hypothetical protein